MKQASTWLTDVGPVGACLLCVAALAWSAPALSQSADEPDAQEPLAEQAPPEPAEAEKAAASQEAARRKRLAKLGSGRITLPEPVGTVMTLDDLIERGMKSNPELVARQHAELFAQYRQKEAAWAAFPSVQLDSTLSIVPETTAFNNVSSNIEQYLAFEFGPLSISSVRIVVPIYTFGKISAAQDLAALGVDQEELETTQKRLEIVAQIREAYVSVQLGKHIQGLVGDGIGAIREEIERQNEAREFGDEVIDVIALRKLQIQESRLSEQMIDNGRLMTLPKKALGVLVQLDPDTFDVTPFNEESDPNALLELEAYQRIAMEQRPELILLNKAITARQLQVELERTKFLPDIFFAVDYSIGLSTEVAPPQTGTISDEDALIALNRDASNPLTFDVEPLFNPYDFSRLRFALGLRLKLEPGRQIYQYRQAQARLAETRALREAARGGIGLQIEKLWSEANANRSKIEARQRALDAAEAWLRQQAIAFESGGGDLQDFLTPLAAYFDARAKILEAHYNYQVSLAKLVRQVGAGDPYTLASEYRAAQAGAEPQTQDDP